MLKFSTSPNKLGLVEISVRIKIEMRAIGNLSFSEKRG